jgi:hypothetical protein
LLIFSTAISMPLVKTEAGQQAFRFRRAEWSMRQRSAFILFDGQRSVEEVLAAVAGLGVTSVDIDMLVQRQWLVPISSVGGKSAVRTPSYSPMHDPQAAVQASVPSKRVAAGAMECVMAPGPRRSEVARPGEAFRAAPKDDGTEHNTIEKSA